MHQNKDQNHYDNLKILPEGAGRDYKYPNFMIDLEREL